MQGLALGIEDGAGDALGAMRGVMTDITDMSPTLTVDYATSGYVARMAPAPIPAANENGGSAAPINLTIDGATTTPRIQAAVLDLLDVMEQEGAI